MRIKKGNKMTLLFVCSPGQLTHRVLPLLNEKKFDNLTIVTTKDMSPFFEGKLNAKIVIPKVEQNLITQETKYKLISNAIRSKLEYRKLFKGIEGQDIYLFYTSWAVVPISYVKKLSKKNKVYLCPEDYATETYNEEKGLTGLFMKLAAKLLLGLDVYVYRWSDRPVWELKKNSFPMEIIEYDGFNNKIPKEFMVDKKLLEGKKVLFLGGKFELECKESLTDHNLADDIYDVLHENFPNSYVFKAHPIDGKLYGRMQNSNHILPQYYLAESLFEHNWDFIIGYHSEALVSAKLHTKAKVISLLHLHNWEDLEVKKYWEDRFKENGLVMPKCIVEFKEILEEK